MSATPDSTLVKPEEIIAELQRQLAECRAERDEALAERDKAQQALGERTAERDEALEQQTATAEVLQAINSSPGDLGPVFDVMLEKAMRLCDAAYGVLWTFEGDHYRAVALQDVPTEYADTLREPVLVGQQAQTVLGRIARGEIVVHIADMAAEEIWRSIEPTVRAGFEVAGFRTVLGVSLRKDEELLGAIAAYRKEVRPFTEKQIAILQNFAAQAVIAMENARLLNEIRQRQQELRVTFDNMVDGVAMFDEALRLAAWNRNFQQLLDLPEEFLAERHGFDEHVRYLVERGEFGETDPETEIHRLRGRLHEHYQFERTRPDEGCGVAL